MKILFTGGGTGGHFYPIIAVAEEVNAIASEKKLLVPKLYFISPNPFDSDLLFKNNIIFKKSPAGKMRTYFSILNFFDLFKPAWGSIKTAFQIFFIYPDVIFCKGGYGSFPTVLASRLFKIPLVVHESDTVPGRVNVWAGKYARKVAVSFPEAAKYFPEDKVALTGVPIRRELHSVATEGAVEFLGLENNVPVVLILGGSQGSKVINEIIVDALPQLVGDFQIIHQVGKENIEDVKNTALIVLEGNENSSRYRPFDYLNALALRMAAGAADIIVSRAGASAIFEIALWGIPSIIIPITEEVSRDQRSNAFSYARSGAAVVIEEENLSASIIASEIRRIVNNAEVKEEMSKCAKQFSNADAAKKIATVLIDIALEHER